MWSTLLLPLLLLHFSNLHATFAMATTHGGLTVIEGSSSSSTTTSTSSTSSSTSSTSSSMSVTSTSTSNLGISVQRKRHRKRNSSWYDYRNYNENTTALEWMNPCGGSYYTPATATERRRAQRPKQIFNQLKRAAGTEYRELSRQEQKGIDIRNMQMWSLHNPNYKFLPKLKPNSTIALKRWYRNMQTYVASFAYLRRVQVNWDRHFLKRESHIAKELKNLLVSSRSMLCELETAVNRTYPGMSSLPSSGRSTAVKQRRQTQLPQISRNDMNKRLKLRSKRRPLPLVAATTTTAAAAAATTSTSTSTVAAATIVEADRIDMRFVKHHYYKFLRTMWQLLRSESKRERLERRQRRQRRQQRQRQQQPTLHQQQQQQHHQLWQQQSQQQQQQRMQLSLSNVGGNRNEFNEVSKPSANAHNHSHAHSVNASNGRRERGKRQQPLSMLSTLTTSSSPTPATSATSTLSSASKLPSASTSASASAATLRHQRRVLRT